jgi:hypothetical protein
MRGSILVGILLIVFAACTPASGGPTDRIGGQALAGPTCAVEPGSPLPGQCAPRPVAGAILVITDATGHEIARATTGADGHWTASVPVGTDTITPQPVQGLLGTARPISVAVGVGPAPIAIQIDYDTGIR